MNEGGQHTSEITQQPEPVQHQHTMSDFLQNQEEEMYKTLTGGFGAKKEE